MSAAFNVRFEPDGVEATVTQPLLISEVAHLAGFSLHLPCAGRGKCGKCVVTIITGMVSEPTDEELAVFSLEELAQGLRLSCQTRVTGDAIIELPPQSRVIGTKAIAGDCLRPVMLEPNVRQLPLMLDKPALEDQRSDFTRLCDAVKNITPDLVGCPAVLRKLPETLRADNFQVTATMCDSRLVDIKSGLEILPVYGVAIDIGTTTVVVYLVDLQTGDIAASAASYNEQGRYGADVVSRIEHCNDDPNGIANLRELVIETVNRTIADACATPGIDISQIYEATVVGNTAMMHMFMGLDPRYLAQAPYIPVTSAPQYLRPEEARIKMHPRGNVYCVPPVAGFVGADTVGVILASDMTRQTQPVLAVDIGTNGEVALWSGERLLVASCAAGPAFEGAQIEMGMRAGPGAIEKISIVDGVLEVKTIGGTPAVGICGSGLFDAMATLLELGVVEYSGRFVAGSAPESVPEQFHERLVGEGNERRFLFTPPNAEKPVYLSQKDVRQLQLSKGAVQAAVTLLLDYVGLKPEDLGEVLLAGAFGNYINPSSAVRIGMLPELPLERIRGVGNAAGAGAILALLSMSERDNATELAISAEHIELSRKPEFQMAFMDTMVFPN